MKDPSSLFLLYKYKFNCIFIFLEQECIQANFTCTLHLKRPEEGFLDKVIGIGEIAGPPGQAAPRPPPEGLEMAVEQTVERRLVSGPRAIDEVERGFRILCHRGVRGTSPHVTPAGVRFFPSRRLIDVEGDT